MIQPAQRMTQLGTETAFEVLARAEALARAGRDIINLGIGQPDFKTPPHIVEAAVKALRDGHHGYTPAPGIPALREAMGLEQSSRPHVELSEPVKFTPDLTCFLPVKLRYPATGSGIAEPRPTNTSGDFVSLAGTDGFVELRRDRDEFAAGYPAPFFEW